MRLRTQRIYSTFAANKLNSKLSMIKNHSFIIITSLLITIPAMANIDMQAHIDSDEGKNAYTAHKAKQSSYYEDDCSYAYLFTMTGDELYGRLNSLMGSTCKLGTSNYSYNTLRDAYVGVDMDLNTPGNIIGYYNGFSFVGEWDYGKTWNREHTWPQSKGADKSIPMGHDMQSVRPTITSINTGRGNQAYGESSNYYDPNEISINNASYRTENLGSYRGDAARVVLYDYIVYGEAGGYKNKLYNGNAQLLNKLGTSGVFESLNILLKWHMQDPPSLTEMVRNDGAQDYQGNRNPFIDYPELAIQLFIDNNSITTFKVTLNSQAKMKPAYQYTLSHGFIAYITNEDGSHPERVSVEGATYEYDATTGRLTISQVTKDIMVHTHATAVDNIVYQPSAIIYNLSGMEVTRASSSNFQSTLQTLNPGLYILQEGGNIRKILL